MTKLPGRSWCVCGSQVCRARSVRAVDGRIANVLKTLVRVRIAGADTRGIIEPIEHERGSRADPSLWNEVLL